MYELWCLGEESQQCMQQRRQPLEEISLAKVRGKLNEKSVVTRGAVCKFCKIVVDFVRLSRQNRIISLGLSEVRPKLLYDQGSVTEIAKVKVTEFQWQSPQFIVASPYGIYLYRPKPIHCSYSLAHYSGFRRISPSILNRFKPNSQTLQCAKNTSP